MIAAAQDKKQIVSTNFNTDDIMRLVLKADSVKSHREQTKELAKQFATTYDGMRRLWEFVKKGVRYAADPPEKQYVRSPARAWQDRNIGTDCKSFTLFITSVLQNLGLRYTIRFAGYEGNPTQNPTHVYPIAILPNGQQVILDAVWHYFDSEKPYKFKIDMERELAYLTGVLDELKAKQAAVKQSIENFSYARATPGQIDLHLKRQGFLIHEIQRNTDAKFVTDAAYNMTLSLGYTNSVNGVLDVIKQKAIDLALKVLMPSAAPFFFYVPVPDAKLNAKQLAKKAKQMRVVNFILPLVNLNLAQFSALVSNEIKKKAGKDPNTIVTEAKQGIRGIGSVAAIMTVIGIAQKVIPFVVDIVKKIGDAFKKSPAEQNTIVNSANESAFVSPADFDAPPPQQPQQNTPTNTQNTQQPPIDGRPPVDGGTPPPPPPPAAASSGSGMMPILLAAGAAYFLLSK